MINPIVEFIGTFVFLSVILISGHAIPIGVALVAMIYFAKGTSGGNFNPAVSFMMYMDKKLSLQELFVYILAQLLGAFCAFKFYSLNSDKLGHYHKKFN